MNFDWVTEGASKAFDYLDPRDNQFMADFLSGAAVGAGQYMLQKDQQKWEEEQIAKKRAYHDRLASAPEIDIPKYGSMPLSGKKKGLLTQGVR